MSKTQDKRQRKKIEHAEFMWQQAQLKAAMAKTDLDLAIETFKDYVGEMTEEQVQQTLEKAKEQYKRIEDYLMSEKDLYLERIGAK